jgi:hypothetical protein
MRWTQAFIKRAIGHPLVCLHADVQWSGPWQQQLPELENRLHAAGIQLGIIYNGDGTAQSGIELTRQSEERFHMVENGARLISGPSAFAVMDAPARPHVAGRQTGDDKPGWSTGTSIRNAETASEVCGISRLHRRAIACGPDAADITARSSAYPLPVMCWRVCPAARCWRRLSMRTTAAAGASARRRIDIRRGARGCHGALAAASKALSADSWIR